MLAAVSLNKIQEKAIAEKNHKSLPALHLYQLNGEKTNLSKINKNNRSTVIIFFNTECEFCQYEIEEIKNNVSLFKSTNIVLISSQEISELISFNKQYKLDSYPNILLFKVDQADVRTTFGGVSSPAIFIYNPSGELLKTFSGETKASAIYKFLGNE